jgi:hypothetical protein
MVFSVRVPHIAQYVARTSVVFVGFSSKYNYRNDGAQVLMQGPFYGHFVQSDWFRKSYVVLRRISCHEYFCCLEQDLWFPVAFIARSSTT